MVDEAEDIRGLKVNALNTTLSSLWLARCTIRLVLHSVMSYDACVHLPAFHALKVLDTWM